MQFPQRRTPATAYVSQVAPNPNDTFTARGQLRSVAIGLACGGAVILVFLLILFNEVAIAPFVRPSQNPVQLPTPVVQQASAPAAATAQPPVLTDPSPKVRIPKINVEIPIVYGLPTTEKRPFELALDEGVVHYPTTAIPGRPGNAVLFGHSSNNIFNPGKYKFAFALLHELGMGDMFYITHDGILYNYEVVGRKVVKPTEMSVLEPVPGVAYAATLITCDPPGTSNNRLIVIGKQVSPVPAGSAPATAATPPPSPEPQSLSRLPGNGPGLLHRLYRSLFGGN